MLWKKVNQRGGTVVEGTAGNTGIGLALVCKEYDLKCIIVIPKTQSVEKKETLKKYGATLIEVDAVPYSNPKNYIKQSKQIALEQAKNNKNGVFGQINLTILLIQTHGKTTAEKYGIKLLEKLMPLFVLLELGYSCRCINRT